MAGSAGRSRTACRTNRGAQADHALRLTPDHPRGAGQHPDLVPSIDAKKAPVAKIVFRPLEVAGHAPRHLADHILSPDDLSPTVLEGFATAFGRDALEELRGALTAPLPPVTRLPSAEFPTVFLPRPGGGDIQATPLAPAETYVRMNEVAAPYFLKREEGRPQPPRGRWHHQEVSSKPQNISGAVGKRRTRFLAKMPLVLDWWEAELHRYPRGGAFPLWHNAAVVDAVMGYGDLLGQSRTYNNQDIRRGLDRRADKLIVGALAFIAETVADAGLSYPAAELPTPPSVVDLLLRRRWTGAGNSLEPEP